MSEASAEFSKPASGDRRSPEDMAKADPAETRRIQQEALIRVMASIRNGSGNGGSSQLPGPGLQRRTTTSWEIFNHGGRKKG
jgi:hypothetical protein